MRVQTLIFALVFLMIFSSLSFAWNSIGYIAVAYVAYKRLYPAVKTRVDALLKLNPDYPKWNEEIPKGTSSYKELNSGGRSALVTDPTIFLSKM